MPYSVGQNEGRAIFGKANGTINDLAAMTVQIFRDGSNEEERSTSLGDTLTSSLTVGFTSSRNFGNSIKNSNSHKITTLPKYCKYMIPDKGKKVNRGLADI
jgi:hypothetical protein